MAKICYFCVTMKALNTLYSFDRDYKKEGGSVTPLIPLKIPTTPARFNGDDDFKVIERGYWKGIQMPNLNGEQGRYRVLYQTKQGMHDCIG